MRCKIKQILRRKQGINKDSRVRGGGGGGLFISSSENKQQNTNCQDAYTYNFYQRPNPFPSISPHNYPHEQIILLYCNEVYVCLIRIYRVWLNPEQIKAIIVILKCPNPDLICFLQHLEWSNGHTNKDSGRDKYGARRHFGDRIPGSPFCFVRFRAESHKMDKKTSTHPHAKILKSIFSIIVPNIF